MRGTIFKLALIFAMVATACGGNNEPSLSNKSALDETHWTLTTLRSQTALKETTATLNFTAGKFAGSDGCNSFVGSYTANSTNIKFDQPLVSTMMACPEPITNQAAAYLQVLGQADNYSTDDKQMSLHDASGKELAAFSVQSSELTGTSWIATAFNNGRQAMVSVMAGTELTAIFGSNVRISGSSGCNSYATPYQIDGGKITIGPVVLSTKKACDQAVMDQETQYLAALLAAASYRIDGSKLELRNADGVLTVSFNTAAQ